MAKTGESSERKSGWNVSEVMCKPSFRRGLLKRYSHFFQIKGSIWIGKNQKTQNRNLGIRTVMYVISSLYGAGFQQLSRWSSQINRDNFLDNLVVFLTPKYRRSYQNKQPTLVVLRWAPAFFAALLKRGALGFARLLVGICLANHQRSTAPQGFASREKDFAALLSRRLRAWMYPQARLFSGPGFSKKSGWVPLLMKKTLLA